jgi:diguanylate cyclase (GGDEF)-like protein
VPKWLPRGKRSNVTETFIGIESVDDSRPLGREGRLFDLVILSLFLHSGGSVHEMTQAFVEKGPDIAEATFVLPLTLDKKRDVLVATGVEGIVEPRLEAAMNAFQEDLTAIELDLPFNHFRRRVLEQGEVVVGESLVDFWQGVFDEDRTRDAEKQLGIKKMALVPMLVEGDAYGIVAFAFDREDIDAEIVELLVGHFTLALRDISTQEDTARYNDVDPVTWVYNKRYISEQIEAELIRCGRYAKPLSLVVIDLDDFGEFNASYGQTLGDRLLRSAAVSLAESISPPELVARLTNDEFAILLPETNRAAAVSVATRLLASLAQVSVFGEDGASEPLKASVAIVCFPEDGTTSRDLIEGAMGDLEQAKREREELAKAQQTRSVNPLARIANDRR